MSATTTPTMTAEEFLAWASRPENAGRWCELDRGEVIDVPPPQHPHGVVSWLVSLALSAFVLRRGRGYICTNDTGIIVERNPDTIRGADLMLFLETPAGGFPKPGYVDEVPSLVVEILSPHDRPSRINRRVGQYLRRGIPMVWLVDPDDRVVSVYRPNEFPKVLDDTDELTGNGVLPDFRCPVRDLFALPAPPPAA